MDIDHRLTFYHKQATSARTRFLLFEYGSICAFEKIPTLAQLYDSPPDNLFVHPAAILRNAEQKLRFPEHSLIAV